MPHIILEIPRVLVHGRDLQSLLKQLHEAIASVPSALLADVKTRVHLLDEFRVADGTPQAGTFIHARLIQTRPRSEEDQKLMSAKVLALLKNFFSDQKQPHSIQLCVETTILPAGKYLKTVLD
jgi:5-carboxymethyl-2-hydroxymuconate isomerase